MYQLFETAYLTNYPTTKTNCTDICAAWHEDQLTNVDKSRLKLMGNVCLQKFNSPSQKSEPCMVLVAMNFALTPFDGDISLISPSQRGFRCTKQLSDGYLNRGSIYDSFLLHILPECLSPLSVFHQPIILLLTDQMCLTQEKNGKYNLKKTVISIGQTIL